MERVKNILVLDCAKDKDNIQIIYGTFTNRNQRKRYLCNESNYSNKKRFL